MFWYRCECCTGRIPRLDERQRRRLNRLLYRVDSISLLSLLCFQYKSIGDHAEARLLVCRPFVRVGIAQVGIMSTRGAIARLDRLLEVNSLFYNFASLRHFHFF